MNWNNLKEMKCPKCGSEIVEALTVEIYRCSHVEEGTCNFRISKARFDEIVTDMYKPKVRRCATFDNQGELNNFDFGNRRRSEFEQMPTHGEE